MKHIFFIFCPCYGETVYSSYPLYRLLEFKRPAISDFFVVPYFLVLRFQCFKRHDAGLKRHVVMSVRPISVTIFSIYLNALHAYLTKVVGFQATE